LAAIGPPANVFSGSNREEHTMKILPLLTCVIALNSAAALAADCEAPAVPSVPDGASATMEAMLEGQKAVKAFQAANLDFMNCLEPMIAKAAEAAKADGASEEAVAAVKELEAKYNAAVSREEEVAGAFNTAIRAYKAANPS
jgi:hypothetical protein